MALCPGRLICCMRYIAGNTGDIPLLKGICLPEKFHLTAVTVADTQFKTIMKMQPPTGFIRYPPIISRKKYHRKMKRKKITAVFCYNIFTSCHDIPPPPFFLFNLIRYAEIIKSIRKNLLLIYKNQ